MMHNSKIFVVFFLFALVGCALGTCYQARVLGCGVVGLVSAIQLQKLGFNVTIHAYASPLQNSNYTYYASPHAGAWWSGNWNEYSYNSYSALMGLTISEPLSTAGQIPASVYYTASAFPTDPAELSHMYYADYFKNYTTAEIQAAYGSLFTYGYEMTAVIVTAPAYTQFLLNKFLASGGSIVHENVTRLSYLTDMANTDLVINSPGLGALWLGDVQDTTMYPQRGQTHIMTHPDANRIYRARGPVDASDPGNFGTYILPRTNGEIVVGGTRQDNDWNHDVSETDRVNIMNRAKVMWPPIANATLIKDNVGFRPGRTAGIRCEVDNKFKVPVVHHYGHAGAGFEESWGSTFKAMKLVTNLFPSVTQCPTTAATVAPTVAPTVSPAPTSAPTNAPACETSATSSAGRVEPFYKFW